MNRNVLLGILGVLIVIAVIVNLRNLRSPAPKPKEASPAMFQRSGAVPAPSAAVPAVGGAEEKAQVTLVKFDPVSVDTTLLKRQLAAGQWGREPFLTAEELQPVAPVVQERAPEIKVTITVNSILVSGDERVAVINGNLYGVGEFVAETGDRISDITREGVLVERDGVKRLIPIRQSSVQVRSRER
jgi:hypothetical protein